MPQTVRAQATSPALAIDAEAFGDNSSPSSTGVTSSFSTAKTNELLLAFIATDGPNFHNSGVSGTTYTYRVRARNLAGDSGYASAVCFNGGTTCGGTVTHP